MTTAEQIIVTIVSAAAVAFFARKGVMADIQSKIVSSMGELMQEYKVEREELKQTILKQREEFKRTILENNEEIKNLKASGKNRDKEIADLKRRNDECDYLHEVAELEMKQLKASNIFKEFKKAKVMTLDDDADDLEEFDNRFSKLSVLNHEGFSDKYKFLDAVERERPEAIIIDYRLDGVTTAENILQEISYEPEVIIISGVMRSELKFKGKDVKFFMKQDNYILKIVKQIIQYLINKP